MTPYPFLRLRDGGRRLWAADSARLVLLTLYYLAIIAALVALYGGARYTPPPFVYQGF